MPPDTNVGSDVLIVQWVTVSLAIIIVSLRIFTQAVLRRTAGWDDWTILIALVSFGHGQISLGTSSTDSNLRH